VKEGQTLSFFSMNVNSFSLHKDTMMIFNGVEKRIVDIVGIQEVFGPATSNDVAGDGVKLPGYHTYNSLFDDSISFSHGVLLAISKRFTSWEHVPPTNTVIAVRIDTDGEPLLVLSVYVPGRTHNVARKETFRHVNSIIQGWCLDHTLGQILLMGDMNSTIPEVSRNFDKKLVSRVFTRGDYRGSSERPTYYSGTTASYPDHVLMRHWDAYSLQQKVWVDRDYSGMSARSQHLPLRGHINCLPKTVEKVSGPVVSREKITQKLFYRIKKSNRFGPLLDVGDESNDNSVDLEASGDSDNSSLDVGDESNDTSDDTDSNSVDLDASGDSAGDTNDSSLDVGDESIDTSDDTDSNSVDLKASGDSAGDHTSGSVSSYDQLPTMETDSFRYQWFICETEEFLSKTGVLKPRRVIKAPRLDATLKKAVDKRRHLWFDWRRSGFGNNVSREKLVDQIDIVIQFKIKQRNIKWHKYVDKITSRWQSKIPSDIRKGWQDIKTVAGTKSKGSGVGGPVLGEKGEMITNPTKILERWAQHFEGLCNDTQDDERDKADIDKLFADRINQYRKEEIDLDDFDWHDVCDTMNHMKPGKAAGISMLPLELFKLGCPDNKDLKLLEKENKRATPITDFHKACYQIIRRIFDHSVVPRDINKACLVPIFKKGDVRDPNMYRGISLIEILLKVLTTLITTKVYTRLQATNFFVPEQGGFRQKEECVAQYTALHEVLDRRRANGERTFIFFSDFRKAFDTVKHERMLRKLEEAGIRQEWLDFFYALYSTAFIAVRTQLGTSPFVSFGKGVRQGCPASPLAFIVFINDLFDNCRRRDMGVSVPGISNDKPFFGLLFADDAVHVCDSEHHLRVTLTELQKWTKTWGLGYGISKCGVMVIEPHESTSQFTTTTSFVMHGEQVPRVSQYTYLGLQVNDKLNLDPVIQDRSKAVLKSAKAVSRLLGNKSIPIGIRIRGWRSLVVSTAQYGGEFFGLLARSSTILKPLESVLIKSMTALIKGSWSLQGGERTRPPMGSAADVMFAELLGSDFWSLTASMRARAIVKYPSLRTWMGTLAKNPPPEENAYNHCWHSRNRRILKPMVSKVAKEIEIMGKLDHLKEWICTLDMMISTTPVDDTLTLIDADLPPGENASKSKSSTEVAEIVKSLAYWISFRDDKLRKNPSQSKALLEYRFRGFHLSAEDVRRASLSAPKIASGFHWLLRIRVGAFITTPMAERAILFEKKHFRGKCPCCDRLAEDTLEHFVFRCPNTDLVRIRRDLKLQKSADDIISASRTIIDTGEIERNHNPHQDIHYHKLSLLCGGTAPTPTTSPTNSLVGDEVEVSSHAAIKDVIERIAVISPDRQQMSLSRIGYCLIASYLQLAIPIRNSILWGPLKSTPHQPG
jgi:hypothetical protein